MSSFLDSSHRGRLEIIMDILKATIRENKPTRIMYGSNLDWNKLHEALTLLEKRKLISSEIVKGHVFYNITAEGMRALFHYDVLTKFLLRE